jgi:hypothetical protein
MSPLNEGASRTWTWVASNKDQLGIILSIAALVVSLLAIHDAQRLQSINEQMEKTKLQPIFLVNEIQEAEKVRDPDGKQKEVIRTALRVVNRGHEVLCVRVKVATISPAVLPAFASNDLTDATRVPTALLAGGFGIRDYYSVEAPDRCLPEITGMLIDTPRTASRWIALARQKVIYLTILEATAGLTNDLSAQIAKDLAAQLQLVGAHDLQRADLARMYSLLFSQRWKLFPILDSVQNLTPYQYFTSYVEVSYRDVLGNDHVSYFKLPGDGLPLDEKAGNQCFKLYDRLVQEGRSASAKSSPTLAELQNMSPDLAQGSDISC